MSKQISDANVVTLFCERRFMAKVYDLVIVWLAT